MAKQIFAQNPQEYNITLAEAVKKIPEFQPPEWVQFVKSGASKKRVPENEDFWYIRAASILRQLYIHGVVGVQKLRTRYGSKKNRGVRPSAFVKASGKIIRTILQQAEAAGLVEKLDKLQHGRRLPQKGRDFLDSITVESKKILPEKLTQTAKENQEVDEYEQQINSAGENNGEETQSEE